MAEAIKDGEAALESDDKAPKPNEVVSRWLKELEAAGTHEKKWRERARKIVDMYRDERSDVEGSTTTRRFNILYSNTEVLKGAMYSQCPVPDVRRRFLDKDPVGRVAAIVLGRALNATLDQQKDGEDFDSAMRASVADMVLPGRGVCRVKYVPTIQKFEQRVPVAAPADGVAVPEDVQQDEQGTFRMEEVQEVVYECTETDYVEWEMFRYSPAKRWKKVRWVAFGELLTRDDLVARFPKVGKDVELKWLPKGVEAKEENEVLKRALVWVVWNKTRKQVVVVSDGYKDAPLEELDDPLKLEDFFPMPRPIMSIWTTDSLIPVPEYAVYQDHAMQLDLIEERIEVLTTALKLRGVVDASIEELKGLAQAADNTLIPVVDFRAFAEKGGLEAAIQFLDITALAKVILELMKQADAKKQQIYELIGISDIMRGATDAQETLGAQKLKAQWGNVRVGPRQGEVQRFARDAIRLHAEIISEHFSAKTLAAMSGVSLYFTAEEKAAGAGQADDPRNRRPTWDEVLQILRSDKLRSFRVDIETDSTVKPQADDEQKNRVALVTAVTGYLEKALPAVQQGMIPKKFATELLAFGVRGFPVGPQIEELLDELSGDPMEQEQGPDKDAALAKMQAELAQHRAQAEGVAKEKQAASAERTKLELDKVSFAADQKIAAAQKKFEDLAATLKQDAANAKTVAEVEGMLADFGQEVRKSTDELRTQVTAAEKVGKQEQAADGKVEARYAQTEAMITGFLTALTDKEAAMDARFNQLLGVLAAPKRVVRDGQGRAAGVEVVA